MTFSPTAIPMAVPTLLELSAGGAVALSSGGADCAAPGPDLPRVGANAVQVQVSTPAPEVTLCYRRGTAGAYVPLQPPLLVYGLTDMRPLRVAYNQSATLSFSGVPLLDPPQGRLLVTTRPCEGTAFSPMAPSSSAVVQSTIGPLAPGSYAVCFFAGPESPAQELPDALVVTGTRGVCALCFCVIIGRGRDQAFFLWLGYPPRGGGGACLPFLKFWVPSAESPSPPPAGGGRPRVGWDFLGKMFVTKIFISPLSSGLPDLVSTLAVLYYICNPQVLGPNLGR